MGDTLFDIAIGFVVGILLIAFVGVSVNANYAEKRIKAEAVERGYAESVLGEFRWKQ
jgi:hypothetical protein